MKKRFLYIVTTLAFSLIASTASFASAEDFVFDDNIEIAENVVDTVENSDMSIGEEIDNNSENINDDEYANVQLIEDFDSLSVDTYSQDNLETSASKYRIALCLVKNGELIPSNIEISSIFEIVSPDNDIVSRWDSSNNPYYLSVENPGQYTVNEISSPTGYLFTNGSISINVLDTDAAQTFELEVSPDNTPLVPPTTVLVKLVSPNLKDVTMNYELSDETHNVVASWEAAPGEAKELTLDIGRKYYLDGYGASEEMSVSVTNPNSHYEPFNFTTTNNPTAIEIPVKALAPAIALVDTTEPTCTEPGYNVFGYYTYLTNTLKITTKEAIGEPLGHKWGDWYVALAPTSTKGGIRERDCSRCLSAECETIPVLEDVEVTLNLLHGFSDDTVMTYNLSDRFGNLVNTWNITKNESVNVALSNLEVYYITGRGLSETVSAHVPDTNGDGKGYLFLANAGLKVNVPLKALSTPIALLEELPPTCEEPGYQLFGYYTYISQTRVVTNKKEVGEPVGHSWSDWKTVKDPTETEDGVKERTCSRCNKKESEPIPKKQPSSTGQGGNGAVGTSDSGSGTPAATTGSSTGQNNTEITPSPSSAKNVFKVTGKGLKKNKLKMKKGKTVKLKAKSNKKVKWSSSNSKIVKVSKNGKLTAIRKGKATITAKSGKKKIKIKVTVK